MAMCKKCKRALQSLIVEDRPGRKVEETLPRYQRGKVRLCFICDRFAAWLEFHNSEFFTNWKQSSLKVVFDMSARIFVKKSKMKDFLPPCQLCIMPEGFKPKDDNPGCEIELDFVSAKAISDCTLPGSRRDSRTAGVDCDLIKTWVHDCTKNHEKCRQKDGEQWYPTRLVHVTSGSQGVEAKLVITENSSVRGPYISLSHRRLPEPHGYVMLDSATMAQLQKGIDIRNLPQDLQHTIEIACQLQFEYLWIDYLCIMQDKQNLTDWWKESLTMDKVYSHAFMNVSATLARDGSEPLWRRRHDLDSPFLSEIKVEGEGQWWTYYVIDSNLWHDEITNAPLNNRGWVFQERFLARRVLHFGENQIGWECRELEALEQFPKGLPLTLTVGSGSKPSQLEGLQSSYIPLQGQNKSLDHGPNLDFNVDENFIDQWDRLVEEYSRCRLTYAADRLIAFAGVPKFLMSTKNNDRYLAGMWESCMVCDLAWFQIPANAEHPPSPKAASCAPSWSWASADGGVVFPAIFPRLKYCFAEILHISEDPLMKEIDVYPNGKTITDHLPIQMKCFCFPLGLEWSPDGDLDAVKVVDFGITFSEKDEESDIRIHLEQGLPVADKQSLDILDREGKLFLVPLYSTYYFLQTMVLVRVNEAHNIYRRLGSVEIEIMADSDIPNNAILGEGAENYTGQAAGEHDRGLNEAGLKKELTGATSGETRSGTDQSSEKIINWNALGLVKCMEKCREGKEGSPFLCEIEII